MTVLNPLMQCSWTTRLWIQTLLEASVPALRKSLVESCILLTASSISMSFLWAKSLKSLMGQQNLLTSLVAKLASSWSLPVQFEPIPLGFGRPDPSDIEGLSDDQRLLLVHVWNWLWHSSWKVCEEKAWPSETLKVADNCDKDFDLVPCRFHSKKPIYFSF
jgi:hypothetical protein